MAKKKTKPDPQLEVRGVFGDDPARALLLARVPADEDGDDDDESEAPEVTLLLQIEGSAGRFVRRIRHALNCCWQAADRRAYCGASHGQVLVYADGEFTVEQVTDEDEELDLVYGANGAPGDGPVVVALANSRAFLHDETGWREIELPEETELVWAAAVKARDEVYIVGDTGLLLFDGATCQALEAPEEELLGLVVRADGDLLATSDAGLYHWSEAEQTWTLHEAPAELTIGIVEQGDDVLLATLTGVLAWNGRSFRKLAKGFDTNFLVNIGAVTFALGSSGGLWSNLGGAWSMIDVPRSLAEDADG